MPKMPANNRMHSGAALQTHDIWQNTIGYDPYAPEKKDIGSGPTQNPYDNFQGLLALARLTGGTSGSSVKGACKRCGGVGHLTFQCRNFVKVQQVVEEVSSTSSDSDDDGDIVQTNNLLCV